MVREGKVEKGEDVHGGVGMGWDGLLMDLLTFVI